MFEDFAVESYGMENPASWNETQKAIDEAIREHEKAMGEEKCGPSLVLVIYQKLKEKGFLCENACK